MKINFQYYCGCYQISNNDLHLSFLRIYFARRKLTNGIEVIECEWNVTMGLSNLRHFSLLISFSSENVKHDMLQRSNVQLDLFSIKIHCYLTSFHPYIICLYWIRLYVSVERRNWFSLEGIFEKKKLHFWVMFVMQEWRWKRRRRRKMKKWKGVKRERKLNKNFPCKDRSHWLQKLKAVDLFSAHKLLQLEPQRTLNLSGLLCQIKKSFQSCVLDINARTSTMLMEIVLRILNGWKENLYRFHLSTSIQFQHNSLEGKDSNFIIYYILHNKKVDIECIKAISFRINQLSCLNGLWEFFRPEQCNSRSHSNILCALKHHSSISYIILAVCCESKCLFH
jgi:hypothetical protein